MNLVHAQSSTQEQAYKTVITSSEHSIIVDEPIDLGGQNLGPTPAHLMAGSLAACTSITLKMYANRKEWAIEEILVDVTLNTEDKSNPFFDRSIQLIGNLDEAQKNRILSIANACPMHKLLERGITINTTLKQ